MRNDLRKACSVVFLAATAASCGSQSGNPAPALDGGFPPTFPVADAGPSTTDGGVPSPDASTAPTARTTCVKVWTCATSCDAQACVEACNLNGSTAAQFAALALEACATSFHCRGDECLYANCGRQYSACARDGNPTEWPTRWSGGAWTGGATPADGGAPLDAGVPADAGVAVGIADAGIGSYGCAGILQCYQSCSPNDYVCARNCYDAATLSGQSYFDDLELCAIMNSCSDDICLATYCATELTSCQIN